MLFIIGKSFIWLCLSRDINNIMKKKCIGEKCFYVRIGLYVSVFCVVCILIFIFFDLFLWSICIDIRRKFSV